MNGFKISHKVLGTKGILSQERLSGAVWSLGIEALFYHSKEMINGGVIRRGVSSAFTPGSCDSQWPWEVDATSCLPAPQAGGGSAGRGAGLPTGPGTAALSLGRARGRLAPPRSPPIGEDADSCCRPGPHARRPWQGCDAAPTLPDREGHCGPQSFGLRGQPLPSQQLAGVGVPSLCWFARLEGVP